MVENFHGLPYEKPLTRQRETIGILRALWRGERLSPELTTLFDARHFRLEMTPARPDILIYVASLQEKAIRDVGRVADGWIPTFWPYRHLEGGIALLEAGKREVGRAGAHIEVAAFLGVVPIDDVEAVPSMLKPLVSFYLGGMGTYYHALFCRYGFRENADLVRALYHAGERKRAAAVSGELLDAIAICGPPDHCCERLAEWRAHGLGTALLNLPTNVPPELAEHFLRTMAPRS